MALEGWWKVPVETKQANKQTNHSSWKNKKGRTAGIVVGDETREHSRKCAQRQEAAYSSGKVAFVCSIIDFLPPIINFSTDAVSQMKLDWKTITTGISEQSNSWGRFSGPRDWGQRNHTLELKQGDFIGCRWGEITCPPQAGVVPKYGQQLSA